LSDSLFVRLDALGVPVQRGVGTGGELLDPRNQVPIAFAQRPERLGLRRDVGLPDTSPGAHLVVVEAGEELAQPPSVREGVLPEERHQARVLLEGLDVREALTSACEESQEGPGEALLSLAFSPRIEPEPTKAFADPQGPAALQEQGKPGEGGRAPEGGVRFELDLQRGKRYRHGAAPVLG